MNVNKPMNSISLALIDFNADRVNFYAHEAEKTRYSDRIKMTSSLSFLIGGLAISSIVDFTFKHWQSCNRSEFASELSIGSNEYWKNVSKCSGTAAQNLLLVTICLFTCLIVSKTTAYLAYRWLLKEPDKAIRNLSTSLKKEISEPIEQLLNRFSKAKKENNQEEIFLCQQLANQIKGNLFQLYQSLEKLPYELLSKIERLELLNKLQNNLNEIIS